MEDLLAVGPLHILGGAEQGLGLHDKSIDVLDFPVPERGTMPQFARETL